MTDVPFTDGDVVFENRVKIISDIVSDYLIKNPHRIYLKPAKINGHPLGYKGATTFKMVKVKGRNPK